MKRGDTLERGAIEAIVLAISSGYVLCYDKSKDEFITWTIDSEGNTYSGHYFNDLEEALNDFKERIGADE